MRKFVLLLLGPVLAALPQETRLEFSTAPQTTIEQRLGLAPDKNPGREPALRQLFEESGCKGERLVEQPVKGSRYPNVICTLPGQTQSVIVVGAHFDFIDRGRGVVDNWSGAALLPSLYQSLAGTSRRHTLVFIGYTGEETGLTGSHFYVKQLTQEQIAGIRAAINLDSLGLSPTKIALTGSDKTLANMLGGVAKAMNAPVSVVNVDKIGTSDSDSFRSKKIPTLDIHSVTQETLEVLHSVRDNPTAIRKDDYYQTYRLVTAYLAYLDGKLD